MDDVDKTSLFKANPPPENHNSEDDNGINVKPVSFPINDFLPGLIVKVPEVPQSGKQEFG